VDDKDRAAVGVALAVDLDTALATRDLIAARRSAADWATIGDAEVEEDWEDPMDLLAPSFAATAAALARASAIIFWIRS
jgi:hypothetical protein